MKKASFTVEWKMKSGAVFQKTFIGQADNEKQALVNAMEQARAYHTVWAREGFIWEETLGPIWYFHLIEHASFTIP